MPEYDQTNYPKPTTDDLTDAETGRDSSPRPMARWPSSNVVPDPYAGPPPSREFETSGGPRHAGRPVPDAAPPTERPGPPPIDAPPKTSL
jgi:hypothetical protein